MNLAGPTLVSIEKDKRRKLSPLFQEYQWNYIPDAILDGYIGEAYVDDENNPHIAVLEIPNLRLKLLGGDSSHPLARKYIETMPTRSALIFGSQGWEDLVKECHHGRLVSLPRYAFPSEKLDLDHLIELKSRLPIRYRLAQLDLKVAQRLADEDSELTADHFRCFNSIEEFNDRGFGFCIFEGDEIVCLATTFLICDKGIEVQIDTHKRHRGKGLATVAAAQILIHSLQNNLDPNWDAATKISAGLAKKLGYTPQGEYSIVFVVKSRMKAVIAGVILKLNELLNK
ncbi:MAG: GNAT family N-acetyltransferase [Anaerolineales bacterium]|jgi:hypothetical protein